MTPAEVIEARVAELVERAPILTAEQSDRLRQIFTGRPRPTTTTAERRSA